MDKAKTIRLKTNKHELASARNIKLSREYKITTYMSGKCIVDKCANRYII